MTDVATLDRDPLYISDADLIRRMGFTESCSPLFAAPTISTRRSRSAPEIVRSPASGDGRVP